MVVVVVAEVPDIIDLDPLVVGILHTFSLWCWLFDGELELELLFVRCAVFTARCVPKPSFGILIV